MMTTTRTIGVMTAVCLLFAATGYAEDYQVRLERPSKAGDVLQLVAKAGETETHRFFEDDKVVQEKTSALKVQLEAEVKILAVDKKGRMTRLALTIRKFSGSVDGKAVEPLAAGSVVIATSGAKKTAFQLKDGKFPEDVERLLGLIIALQKDSDDSADDDDLFGTSARKKVGDKWPINKAAMIKFMKEGEVTIKEGDISGTVGITELRKVDGVPCLHIEAQFSAANFTPPLPEGAKLLSVKMTSRMIGDYPVDVKIPRLRIGLTLNVAMEMQMPADPKGQTQRMEISWSKWMQRECKPGREKPKAAATTKKAGN